MSETSQRIANAVNNEEWQQFRLSLKGEPTRKKLQMLRAYWEEYSALTVSSGASHDNCGERAWRAVRVDNYIKALCRGGQLFRGESLQSMIRCDWDPDIKSN